MSVKLDTKDSSAKLFYLFLATDFAFIILHIIHISTDLITSDYFSIERERGYAELFQYIKEYWIALILVILAVKWRSLLCLIWSLLFSYLLLDDCIAIHEKLGGLISQQLAFSPAFNLRAKDFGELLVSASVGLFFLIAIGIAYRFGDRISREISRYLIVMLFALALFGIVGDLLHMAFAWSFLKSFLGLLEDGGEMIVMSVIAWFVFKQMEPLKPTIHPETLKQPVSTYQD
jgi:uncharacterized membrane protein